MVAGGQTYGTDSAFAPVVYADDGGAEVLGHLAGSARPGLVVKRLGDWTSVYSSAPLLPARLLRNLAIEAGAHVFVDSDDTVYANRSLLSLVVDEAGIRHVHLPKAATVEDLFGGEVIAENASEFDVHMSAKSTALWRLR